MAGSSPTGVESDLWDLGFLSRHQSFIWHATLIAVDRARRIFRGMTMGPWGLHYEAHADLVGTIEAWHEYLSRCQYLLQQGLFSADICYVSAE